MAAPLTKNRARHAEKLVEELFKVNGWHVDAWRVSDISPDLTVGQAGRRFAVFVKALSEGRSDRAIPLLSQAILQARAGAFEVGGAHPLAIIYVEHATESLVENITEFADRYAPDVAIGIVTADGARRFRGEGLEALNSEPKRSVHGLRSSTPQVVNLFSDLNQWMLKVLLAPELPEDLLTAPRGKYRSGLEFANAADVSSMSAARFLQQLRVEGFLDSQSTRLSLVRRPELFRRWRAALVRSPLEVPVRFAIKASADQQIRRLLRSDPSASCLGMFAAADELRLGHVSGVPPYVYVPKLPRAQDAWKSLMPVTSGPPDLIIRQTPTPQSTFRGAVRRDGIAVADVIQIWLDVSSHPSRGSEQADLIYRTILRPLTGEMNL